MITQSRANTSRVDTARRMAMLIGLYAVPIVGTVGPVLDPDLWFHIRTGQWILQHRSFPWTDPFTGWGMGHSWIAYSWLFEILIYGIHRAFGLVGLALFTVIFAILITGTLHVLVRSLRPPYFLEIAVTALGILAMKPVLTPRPWLFTILFFTVELHILLAARRSQNYRLLLWLPPLFVLWANVHVQLAYGLFVIGLVAVESLVNRLLGHAEMQSQEHLPLGRVLLTFGACVTATLITPYYFHLYTVLFRYMSQPGPLTFVTEFLALQFRHPSNWAVLALALGAAGVLGWRRRIYPFESLLFLTGIFLSFRSARDVWFVVIVAVVILAKLSGWRSANESFTITKIRALFVTVGIVLMVIVTGRAYNISPAALQAAVRDTYPDAAAAVVEERGLSGPLYNHYDWGSYLIWRLPQLRVSIDGRTHFHGDDRIRRSLDTWQGNRDWASDPDLAAARLVIAQVNKALASLLRLDPRFELVYEDKVAVVFVARQPRQRKSEQLP